MRKVLVHVGYPKAASTTLQNGVFLELHKKGLINFLGRAFESGYFGQNGNKSTYKSWFKSVLKDRYDKTLGELSESVLNVLSEGLFMMNERHEDHVATPERLRSYFSSRADKLEVLLVLRAQSHLLPSYYVQNYYRMTQPTFDAFLDHLAAGRWAGEGKIFNLRDVVCAYVETLGRENVHLLLFEDFVQDRPHFSAALGKAMGLPAETILASLGGGHMNQTRKEEAAVVVRKLNKTSWRHHAVKLLGLFGFGESLKVRLAPISEEQRRRIFETFKGSNEEMAAEYSLDRERMQRYGYF